MSISHKVYCFLFSLGISVVLAGVVDATGWENVFANNVLPLHHYGNKSYYMGVHYRLTYLQAHEFCSNIGMSLLSVTSEEENDRIYKYIRDANKGDEYWTSGTRALDGETWVWMSNGKIVDYTNWAAGEPNTQYEMCIQLYHYRAYLGVFWYDRDCNTQLLFICERQSASSDGAGKGCPNAFQYPPVLSDLNLLTYNNKRYYLSRHYNAKFIDAMQFCKLIQMRLVSITSEEENTRLHKYIRDTFGGVNFWSSGTRFLNGKSWIWLSTRKMVEYTNWQAGVPDSQTDNCIYLIDIKNDGLFWNDGNCEVAFPFICESFSPNGHNETVITNGAELGSGNGRPAILRGKSVQENINGGEAITIDTEWYVQQEKTTADSPLSTIIDGQKYQYSKYGLTHSEALQYCIQHQMQLVEIESAQKIQTLKSLFSKFRDNGLFWTAGIKLSDGSWSWSNTRQPVTYTNWAVGKPNSNNNDICIGINYSGEWSNQNCRKQQYFICEAAQITQCGSQPIVNVYVHNNLVTDQENTVGTGNFLTSRNESIAGDGVYYVQVTNNIDATSGNQNTTSQREENSFFFIEPTEA